MVTASKTTDAFFIKMKLEPQIKHKIANNRYGMRWLIDLVAGEQVPKR